MYRIKDKMALRGIHHKRYNGSSLTTHESYRSDCSDVHFSWLPEQSSTSLGSESDFPFPACTRGIKVTPAPLG